MYTFAKEKLGDLGGVVGQKMVKSEGKVGQVVNNHHVKTTVHVVAGVLEGMF